MTISTAGYPRTISWEVCDTDSHVNSSYSIIVIFSFVILETGKHLHLVIKIKWLKQIKEKKVVIFLGKMRLSFP